MPQKIDVRDEEGHLLFVFDAETDVIEIKSRKKIVKVDMNALRFRVKRAVLQTEPETTVTVKAEDDPTQTPAKPENGLETPLHPENEAESTSSPAPSLDTEKEMP